MRWTIDDNNDVDMDDHYTEWWEVTDGTMLFKSDRQEDAEWLCTLLNKIEDNK